MRYLITILMLLAAAVTTAAHEYWFEPETFFPSVGGNTVVHLYVGDGLIKDGEERKFELEKTPMFKVFSQRKTLDLLGVLVAGATPIYQFSADAAGNYLLGMERNWSYIKIEPEKFEAYLSEDGIDYIIAEREKLGERKKEGRERYSRFIKSLLQVGDKRDDQYKRKLGLKLELIPLENPYSKKIGDTITFQLLFDGKPAVGRTVFADNREAETQKMVTDSHGKFSFKVSKSGLWLARLVIMQRCKADCGEADWESFWGAFSFGVK